MTDLKTQILNKICYTDLVYDRVRKKLNITISNKEIEFLILKLIENTEKENFKIKGKNSYIFNSQNQIRLTINLNTFRLITVDKLP